LQINAQYVISAETSGCIACGDIVINKQLSIICTPEVVLDVPASPGICPSDKSYIDIDGDCGYRWRLRMAKLCSELNVYQ